MYSLSTDVLGILISRAVGKPLDELLKVGQGHHFGDRSFDVSRDCSK